MNERDKKLDERERLIKISFFIASASAEFRGILLRSRERVDRGSLEAVSWELLRWRYQRMISW